MGNEMCKEQIKWFQMKADEDEKTKTGVVETTFDRSGHISIVIKDRSKF